MVLMLNCVSTFMPVSEANTTIVYACPASVRYEYRDAIITPMEAARAKHRASGPRDDRMASGAVQKSKKKVNKKRVAKRKGRR